MTAKNSVPVGDILHQTLLDLYHCDCPNCTELKNSIDNEKPPKIDSKAFSAAMKDLHAAEIISPEIVKEKGVKALINTTYKTFKNGVEIGISNNVIPESMAKHLDRDTFLFSGVKVYNELKEGSLKLRDKEGNIKPFNQFLNDVKTIDEKYNQNYLNAEYHFAIASSQMAAKWADYAADGDRYWLQYRTAGDELVRESHAELNETTLPIDDPFWDSYLPPLGWNCRCTTVQVRKEKYPESNSERAIQRGERATTQIGKNGKNRAEIFRFNPGKQEVIFPPNHPYNLNKEAKLVKEVLIGEKNDELFNKIKAIEVNTIEDVEKVLETINKEKKWFERGFKEIKDLRGASGNGKTDGNGNISLKTNIKNRIVIGFNKLKKGVKLNKKEEESIATLWHEITHNRSKIPLIPLTFDQTKVMELANEFVARNTMNEFYEVFKTELHTKEFITSRENNGYNIMVVNYQNAIEKLGLSKKEVVDKVKVRLFNDGFENQKSNIIDSFSGAKKLNGTKLKTDEIEQIVDKTMYYDKKSYYSDDPNKKFDEFLKGIINN